MDRGGIGGEIEDDEAIMGEGRDRAPEEKARKRVICSKVEWYIFNGRIAQSSRLIGKVRIGQGMENQGEEERMRMSLFMTVEV